MENLPINGFIAGVGECDEREMVIVRLDGCLHKGISLSTEGLGRINVVCHLHQFYATPLFADHEVYFLASTGGLVVVDVMEKGSGAAQQLYIDDALML